MYVTVFIIKKYNIFILVLYLKYPEKFPKSNVPTKIGEKGALGVKVDESIDTVRAGVSDIIQGWDLGIARACEGEQRKIMMSVDMAYGTAGAFRVIPPEVIPFFRFRLYWMWTL